MINSVGAGVVSAKEGKKLSIRASVAGWLSIIRCNQQKVALRRVKWRRFRMSERHKDQTTT